MTSQEMGDAYLDAWRLLRSKGVAAPLRLPVIDALVEMERAKMNIGELSDHLHVRALDAG